MSGIILTQNTSFIIGPVAKLLGFLMNAIFNLLDLVGIPNIGLSIILFTIVIYLLMTPLTVKQQRFSKLSAKMNPELQAVSKKYKNKKDNDSMMAMNQETQAVYAKYGVSPTGSCLQLIIQMPILFALYRVIYAMPAYVTKIKEAFFPLVDNLIAQQGSVEFIQGFEQSRMYANQFSNTLFTSGNTDYIRNTFIDVLNKATTAEWLSIGDHFTNLSADVTSTLNLLNEYNNFLGINISNSPSFVVKDALATGSFLLVIGALMVPLLAALTQWLNTKLMPQPNSGGDGTDTMASTMKTMNMMMPIMSMIFCFTLPIGMGIYWIAGAVIRSIQQVMINKHIDKIDLDELIKKNLEKTNKKRAKQGLPPQKLNDNAKITTRNVAPSKPAKPEVSQEEKDAALQKATEYYNGSTKQGSIASKANMVKQYNEKNNKK